MSNIVFKHGLCIGDFVTYKVTNIVSNSNIDLAYRGIVLNKKFIFSSETQWGKKGFFEYEIFVLNKIKKVKTKHMRILNRKSLT